jgi:hypothetical protein
MTYFSLVIVYINMTEGGKRRANKSLKQWVAFVKKVAKEEGLEYKDAMKRAKARSDKGEKWQKGGDEPTNASAQPADASAEKPVDEKPVDEKPVDEKPAAQPAADSKQGGRRQSRQGRRQSQRKGGRRQSRRNRRQSRRDRR